MPFSIIREDIARLEVDAVVNAANTSLLMGGGVCGAIFHAAGADLLQEACRLLAPVKTGEAVITPGFGLPAKYVIHAVGPVYCAERAKESEDLLRSAYRSAWNLAVEHDCQSIAFPLISAGIYGYPKAEALQVAVDSIRDLLMEADMHVYLVVFDRDSFLISEKLIGAVETYIDENYVDKHLLTRQKYLEREGIFTKETTVYFQLEAHFEEMSIEERIGHMDEPFHMTLLKWIDAKGKTDSEVYKKANIDRKLFSKIRTGKGYMPGKRTILALAIGLELSFAETEDLLERAGYALSHSQKFDVIVEYFIINGRYDIFEINEVLFQYDQPLLGLAL